ncbi:Carbohydrate sulfotransferase 9 [Holothuria leucospilota]|uniref:Carbohydrate sulfotransferase n=1 Tax=Holothuria leucospilota TaxID=206669 RepID=A0A9Q1H1F8_HOLLE|nr:Carbohydrate sulfotransferase 9 [Holothuria leucospilota]
MMPETSNDWSKDCTLSSTTNGNRSINNSCLKQLDMSEKMNCDSSCQESIQRYRKMSTRRACINNSKSLHPSIWDDNGNLQKKQLRRLNHLFPIENSNLIYCSIPKDGCSAWKRVLLNVTGDISSSFRIHNVHPKFKKKIKSLASYNVTEAQMRLKTYKKILFVREPMERLLSLFFDKAVRKVLHLDQRGKVRSKSAVSRPTSRFFFACTSSSTVPFIGFACVWNAQNKPNVRRKVSHNTEFGMNTRSEGQRSNEGNLQGTDELFATVTV